MKLCFQKLNNIYGVMNDKQKFHVHVHDRCKAGFRVNKPIGKLYNLWKEENVIECPNLCSNLFPDSHE